MTGRLVAVVAASGAGKDTLLDGALAARPELRLVRRVITRPESAGGEGFEGVTVAEFERRRAAGDFACWWPAHGLLYGVPRVIDEWLSAGETVIFNGSRDALPTIREAYPDLGVVLITAPKALLRERLLARGRETAADTEARLARADRPAPEGAVEVANDGTIEAGVARLVAAIDGLTARAESA